ncbi:hypothetical protein F4780DRAFT_23269 [Xylariomycetidae sp. FL0641]|nr:hypothetical protein F4780DRAFT_23269 [Xylariomycetidae sp. FL0641]
MSRAQRFCVIAAAVSMVNSWSWGNILRLEEGWRAIRPPSRREYGRGMGEAQHASYTGPCTPEAQSLALVRQENEGWLGARYLTLTGRAMTWALVTRWVGDGGSALICSERIMHGAWKRFIDESIPVMMIMMKSMLQVCT